MCVCILSYVRGENVNTGTDLTSELMSMLLIRKENYLIQYKCSNINMCVLRCSLSIQRLLDYNL